MKTAGIRQARQHLSVLLEEVRKGREVVLTERGRPVAKLVPAGPAGGKPFRGLREFRRTIRLKPGRPLSKLISEDRDDRI